MKNLTVHLFSDNGTFHKTCYPLYSNNNPKGWCSTRPPGDFVNKIPTEDKGWGFCSNAEHQDMCNIRIANSKEDDTPYIVNLLEYEYCFEQLKANLEVEQPEETIHRFRERIDKAQTICVGQFHQHSFDNERFVVSSNNSYLKLNITDEYKVSFMKVVDIPIVYQICGNLDVPITCTK
jgi:hypothetical protein